MSDEAVNSISLKIEESIGGEEAFGFKMTYPEKIGP